MKTLLQFIRPPPPISRRFISTITVTTHHHSQTSVHKKTLYYLMSPPSSYHIPVHKQTLFQTLSIFLSFGPISVSPKIAHNCVTGLQPHNRGLGDTKICPSNVFNALYHIPCIQFLPIASYFFDSSHSLPSSLYAAASAIAHEPARSIPSCS